jgi:UMF1 family MFS transporter
MVVKMPTPAQSPNVNLYRRRWLAWAFYDWGNSAVVTIIIATIFPIFYVSIAEPQLQANATNIFSFTVTIALLLSALAGPLVGTLADITGRRKQYLIISTILGAIFVCAMIFLRTGTWAAASILFVVVQIFLNTALGLYDALLSHVTLPQDRNRVSALGYGLGYIGGGLILAINLALILFPQTFGIDGAETATRIAFFSAGVWWLLFALPLFRIVPEPPAAPLKNGTRNAAADTLTRLAQTFRAIRSYRELFKMLVAFWLYSDGIGTIIQLATAYGRQLGLEQTVLIGALLVTQFVAFPFSIMFGRIPNPQSKNRSFFVAFILWTVITFPMMGAYAASTNASTSTTFTLIALNQISGLVLAWIVGRHLVGGLTAQLTTKRAIILGLCVYAIVSVWGYFLQTAAEFWMLAWLVGTVQGGTQALSRSLYAALTPSSKSGEFFGFYGFSDKFAGILGPLLFGVVGVVMGNPRLSILSILVFFVLGIFLLQRVNEAEGQRIAQQEDAAIGYHDDLPQSPVVTTLSK